MSAGFPYRHDRPARPPVKRRTDWLAWFMQAVVGLGVGALFGLFSISTRRGMVIAPAHLAIFLWGAALLGAGLAARYGDLLWSSYRIIPIDEPSQTWPSKLASFLVGTAGLALLALALGRNFHWLNV